MKTGDNLRAALRRLEDRPLAPLGTKGEDRDARVAKALAEMIREQLTHAHTRPPTRTIR